MTSDSDSPHNGDEAEPETFLQNGAGPEADTFLEHPEPKETLQCVCPFVSQRQQRTLADIRVFVALLAFYVLFYTATEMYITAILTTLEKRFGFSSSKMGALMSMKDLAYVITIPIVSHFGKRSHIPRLIGLMGLMAVLAGYIMCLPNFLFPRSVSYENGYSNGDDAHNGLCHRDASDLPDSACDSESLDGGVSNGNYGAYALLLTGCILLGIGQTCVNGLGSAYIDDMDVKGRAAMFIGLLNAMKRIGPMIGFLFASAFTLFPDDFKDPGFTTSDPRWIGAWWLGYLVCPTLLMIPCTCLIFYPKITRVVQKQISEEHSSADGVLDTAESLVKDFLSALKRLFTNPRYAVFVLNWCLAAFAISGMFPFVIKYLEVYFNLSTSKSNLLVGALLAPLMAGGDLIGGIIIFKRSWKPRHMAYMYVANNLQFVVVVGLLMGVNCPASNVLGIPGLSDVNCTNSCQCGDSQYQPVCVTPGLTFYSPCTAGCLSRNDSVYTHCGCMNDNATATAGTCESECPRYPLYIVVFSVSAFLFMTTNICGYMICMRTVDERDKSLAVGLGSASVTLVGFVPGPIIYGVLVDSSCIFWQRSCGRENGACLFYNKPRLRDVLHGVTMVFDAAASVTAIVTTVLIVSHEAKQKLTTEISAPVNGIQVPVMDPISENSQYTSAAS